MATAGGGGGSVREEVAVHVHEHRFLVTKLLESLNTALLCVSGSRSGVRREGGELTRQCFGGNAMCVCVCVQAADDHLGHAAAHRERDVR